MMPVVAIFERWLELGADLGTGVKVEKKDYEMISGSCNKIFYFIHLRTLRTLYELGMVTLLDCSVSSRETRILE